MASCSEDQTNTKTVVVLKKYSEVAEVRTDVASEVSVAYTKVALAEVLGLLLDH